MSYLNLLANAFSALVAENARLAKVVEALRNLLECSALDQGPSRCAVCEAVRPMSFVDGEDYELVHAEDCEYAAAVRSLSDRATPDSEVKT